MELLSALAAVGGFDIEISLSTKHIPNCRFGEHIAFRETAEDAFLTAVDYFLEEKGLLD